MESRVKGQRGITLVELVVAMAITGVVATAVFAVYFSQNRTYMVQEQVVDTQQSVRLAMKLLAKELRMAGLQDPFNQCDAGFTTASATSVTFTLDHTGDVAGSPDGDTDDRDEALTYSFSGGNLVRNNGYTTKVLVQDIDAAEFYYQLEDGTRTTTPDSDQLESIRAVQFTLLARTENEDNNYRNSRSYDMPSGATVLAGGDGFRRRLLSTTVRCRNMGL